MTTDKKNIEALAEVCRIRGIKHIVFSPGSRSAPLVIAFSQIVEMECTVIADERVAGFFALGIAQQSQQPVAIVCTSGTAVLNLAPAICEAYYQQVPLLILTADRPPEYIGIGENQAIHQTDIYRNYIKGSYTLPDSVREAAKAVSEAIYLSTSGYAGPVHINIPLSEPLYGCDERSKEVLSAVSTLPLVEAPDTKNASISAIPIHLSTKNMLLCGMHEPDEYLQGLIVQLSERGDFVVIAEPLANLQDGAIISNPDGVIPMIHEEEAVKYKPQTIISIGRQIVSKRLRQFLRQHPADHHYHISTDRGEWNGLGAKQYTHVLSRERIGLEALLATDHPTPFSAGVLETEPGYRYGWQERSRVAYRIGHQLAADSPFCDWPVFAKLISSYPEGACVQYGNSSPIRYACLFPHKQGITIHSNRGTSGIDGCVSTAAGAAFGSEKLTVCIVGDISFLYDSNALWHHALSPSLRIVMINNGGGNIFRLIAGPGSVEGFEKFFETRHHLSAMHLAQMHQIPYYFCGRAEDMDFTLELFYKPQDAGRPAILEIKTDGETSEKVYKRYFELLSR